MKDLKQEERNQLKKVRDKVYNKLSDIYIYGKDKFVQQIIKETYNETKEELLEDLFREWILINIKESNKDFFMVFEKKFRADLQKMNSGFKELKKGDEK